MLAFGLLHCQGDNEQKAEALYRAIQDGGPEKHQFLSATDKDIEPVFDNLVKFALTDLTKLMIDIAQIHPMDLEDRDGEVQDFMGDIIENNFLEPIFGVDSRLSYDEFVNKVCLSKAFNKLFFKPQNLRMLVMHKLNVTDVAKDHLEFNKVV